MEYADFRSHGRIICTIVCTRTWNQARMNSTQNLYEAEHTKRALLQNSALGLGCVALSTASLPDEGASATMQSFESSQSPLPRNPANMLSPAFLTAQDFAAVKSSLPEAGRWHELHDGQTVLLSAPDDTHGTIVLNLSRALAEWFNKQPQQTRGYACHDLGLHVNSAPDTVYVPAISIFRQGKPFSQYDNVIATEVPKIVIDIASSNDRRRDMRLRTTAYLRHGVECVWVPDPFKKEVQVIRRSSHTLALGKWQTLEMGELLPGFVISVENIFVQPKWWDGKLPDVTT